MKKIFTFILALVASVGISSAAITVRLDPSSCSDWSTVRLWAWADESNVFDSWPGQIVSKDGDGWYAYTFSSSISSVNIIWTNGTAQTVDITGITSSTCYKLNSQTGKAITVSVVDCSSGSSQGGTVVSGRYKIGDLYYNLNATDQTAEVTYELYWNVNNYQGLTTANIPASVTYSGTTYSVTSIGDDAFRGCSGLTSVTIGNSVTSIGGYAFSDCSGLTSVTIPNSVTSIGYWAFYGCSSLTSVTIGNSVTSIGDYAFADCSGLTSVTIPNSVTSIGRDAFSGCSGLTSVTIGNSVTSIEWYAFSGCSSLTSVTIPNSVTSIGYWAFYGCSSLTSVTIPNSVTSIGDYAFADCSGLTSVTIPNSVTSIGWDAFSGCSSLTSVTIPNSVTSIGNSAFSGCSSLTSVTIHNSVTSIGNSAFSGCSSLTSVTIPNSVTSIGNSAFSGCSSLTSVTIPNSVTSIGDYAFAGCSSLTSVTIPNSVTSIGDYAFAGCSSLTSISVEAGNTIYDSRDNCNAIIETATNTLIVGCQNTTIPNSVTSIGEYAFYGCSSLTSVTIPNSVTSIGGWAFEYCSSLTSIYVPCGEMERFKQMLNWEYQDKVKYAPLPYTITINAENGSVTYPQMICDDMLLNATPDYGYHFVKWSDGNTDNPRTIVLTQDTTFTAEFAKNTYTISTTSANPEWGTTAGGKSALYLDEVEISATPNYGYHFVQWSDREYICDDWWDGVCYYGHWGDYNIEPTRTIVVERDSVITATFAKNVYTITKNAEHGYISGNWEAEYLDEVTMTVVPDYGYHFTQWSDGNTDNPREIVLTQDTAFTAEFAVDRSGTCGNDYALTWSYNPTDKCLTIQGSGAFDQHIQYGVEAPGNMEKLIVFEGVTTIGAGAFAYQATLLEVSLPTNLQTIGEQAFYNCTGLTHIYNFRERPCVAYSNSFDGIDKFNCTLHVLSASVDMYKAATAWRDFYYIQTIDATETTVATDKVSVEPTATTADVVWPAMENAATYELVIKDKNGNVVCTLIFNANGQLTQIAFGAPARDNAAQAAGFAFTVTGLEESTSYDLTITAKDGNGTTLDEKTIAFSTSGYWTGADALQAGELHSSKIMRDGQVLIMRGGKMYNLQGVEVK